MNNYYRVDDVVQWYPGESDYPSVVRLIAPVDYKAGYWWVNYAEDPIDDNWMVSEQEMTRPVEI